MICQRVPGEVKRYGPHSDAVGETFSNKLSLVTHIYRDCLDSSLNFEANLFTHHPRSPHICKPVCSIFRIKISPPVWQILWHMASLRVRTVTKDIWDLPCLLHLLFWFHVSNCRNFWKNERWKSYIKYLSIMKLFHLQKPRSKWRLQYVRMLTCETAFCKKAQNFV